MMCYLMQTNDIKIVIKKKKETEKPNSYGPNHRSNVKMEVNIEKNEMF